MPNDPQLKMLDEIIEIQQQQHQVKAKGYYSAFVVHFFLKAVPLGLLIIDEFMVVFFEERYGAELVLLFIVVEFWFTKNISGKRMIGARWFFGEDEHGVERLMFECRANPEFVDFLKPKLFWVVQFSYCIIPVLLIIEAFFMIPNTGVIDWRKIELDLCALASGIANNFFFIKISGLITDQQQILKTRIGMEGVRKLGLASITSHY